MYPISEERKEELVLEKRAKEYFLKNIVQFMNPRELYDLQCKIAGIMLAKHTAAVEDNEHLRNKFL